MGVLALLKICKILVSARFVEFVLGRFSHFHIEIAYLNFTFCGAWTPCFFEFSWKLSQIQQNENIRWCTD